MVLNQKRRILASAVGLAAVMVLPCLRQSGANFSTAFSQTEAGSGAERQIKIRAAELGRGGLLRVFASVREVQDGTPYPISTLDRSSFSLFLAADAQDSPPALAGPGAVTDNTPLRLSSLGSFSSTSPRRQRGLVLGFTSAELGHAREPGALRGAAAEVLPQVFGDFVEIYSLNQQGAHAVATSVPEHAENVKILQRLVSAPGAVGVAATGPVTPEPAGHGELEQGLCAAAKKFTEWAPSLAGTGDQLILILALAAAPSEVDTHTCWERLEEAHVAVYLVLIGRSAAGSTQNLARRVASTGGFIQWVQSPLDAFRALSTVAANLNDEYVLETRLEGPLARLGPAPLLHVQASYHGDIIRSAPWRLARTDVTQGGPLANGAMGAGTDTEAVSPAPATRSSDTSEGAMQPAGTGEDKDSDSPGGNGNGGSEVSTSPTAISLPRVPVLSPSAGRGLWLGLTAAGLCLLLLRWLQLRRRRYRIAICRLCGVDLVATSCPLTSLACVAQLFVFRSVSPGREPELVQVIALAEGEYSLGKGRSSRIKLRYPGVRRRHATLILKNRRALFESAAPATDTVNGWVVREPRLLGHGARIEIGSVLLRFEAKKPQ